MTRLALNKATLHAQKRQIVMYRSFLPALELKRSGLMLARLREAQTLRAIDAGLEALIESVGARLAMLAAQKLQFERLIPHYRGIVIEESLLGARLPKLLRIEGEAGEPAGHVWPHWTGRLLLEVEQAAHLRIRADVSRQRLAILDRAVAKASQRCNLLDKVLIPQARTLIATIETRLDDEERAGVAIAKIAKARRSAATL